MKLRGGVRISPRAGFTLLEVLVALAIFLVLAVPLGYMTIYAAQGKAQARRIDDALALAREEWGIVRRTPVKLLRDSVREAGVGDHSYRIVRTVSDTVANGILDAPSQLGAKRDSAKSPGVLACIVRQDEAAEKGDTIRCFGWRVPRVEMQP